MEGETDGLGQTGRQKDGERERKAKQEILTDRPTSGSSGQTFCYVLSKQNAERCVSGLPRNQLWGSLPSPRD